MSAGLAVLLALLVHRWMPITAHARIAGLTGRGRAVPLDERFLAWRRHRASRTPGQPATTRLLQALIAELAAGIVTAQAFTHVLGDACSSPEALSASPPTVDRLVWRDVAQVWAASDQAGYSLAQALQRIHAYALVDQEVAREVQANAAAPRFGLVTLLAMPVLTWVIGSSMGGSPTSFLLHNPIGWACAVVGAACYGLAVIWMRLLTKEALR